MPNHFVVLVNGFARTGKDTVVQMMTQQLIERDYEVTEFSSIEPIRTMLKKLGIPVHLKTDAERDLMAEVGAALEKYNGYRTSACLQLAQDFFAVADDKHAVMFLHMREMDLITKMRALLISRGLEMKTLLVERPGVKATAQNSADQNVMQMSYDLVIRNNGGLRDLDAKCRYLIDNNFLESAL